MLGKDSEEIRICLPINFLIKMLSYNLAVRELIIFRSTSYYSEPQREALPASSCQHLFLKVLKEDGSVTEILSKHPLG